MAGVGRVGGAERARRINAACELLETGVPVAEAASVLAGRFQVSTRQARRYLDAARAGRVPVPEESVVFTVKLPVALAERVRGYAHEHGLAVSAVVAQALTDLLRRGRRNPRRR